MTKYSETVRFELGFTLPRLIFEMRKNNDVFVDYKLLKTCVSIIMVLDHYGWVRELKGTGNTVRSDLSDP